MESVNLDERDKLKVLSEEIERINTELHKYNMSLGMINGTPNNSEGKLQLWLALKPNKECNESGVGIEHTLTYEDIEGDKLKSLILNMITTLYNIKLFVNTEEMIVVGEGDLDKLNN